MRSQPIQRAAHARIAAAALATILAAGGATAQDVDCEALRQQMAALTQPDPTREARFDRAIQQQRSELTRTQAYSDQIGCGGFASLFGGAPPQCNSIADRVSRMQSNLDALESQARLLRNGDPDRAADLEARYDASCRTGPGNDAAVYADPGLMQGDGNASIMDEGTPQRPQGGSKAICVRTCDGGYFPLASGMQGESLDGLQALCSAQCPNTEAKLYTTSDTDDIGNAVGLDGSPYTALPAAFKFAKTHEAACTCKPPNQSWAQALAKAEDMLDKSDTHDVMVTEQMSADMARPVKATPIPKKGSKRRSGLDLPSPALPDAVQLGALGAQAPTAGTASAGIAAGAARTAPMVPTGEGAIKQMPGPDGTTRTVRIVGPGL